MRSYIGGNLQLFSNSGGASIYANTIRENLQCKQNSPAPMGAFNVVGGQQ